MYTGIDARGEDLNPKQDARPAAALFFMAFIVVGNFFLLNLFIGVVVDNFQRMSALFGSKINESQTTRSQTDEATAVTLEEPSWRRQGCVGAMWQPVRKFVEGPSFESLIAACIVLNVAVMASQHYDSHADADLAFTLTNLILGGVFLLEAAVKLAMLGPVQYFQVAWNRFDFVLVMISIGGTVTQYGLQGSGVDPGPLRALRAFRVARLLHLIKGLEGLRALMRTVMQALPQVLNMGLLLGLVFFIFACAGVELFGRVSCSAEAPCIGMHRNHAHFRDFPSAVLTLFRMVTGDNGAGIMQDTMREPPLCDDSYDCKQGCCAIRPICPVYFCLFTVASQFVLLNVVVAVLLQELQEAQEEADAEQDEKEAQEEADLVQEQNEAPQAEVQGVIAVGDVNDAK